MLELGVGADIVRGIGWLFIGLMVAAIAAALWIPKSRLGKAIATVAVLGGIGAIYVPSFVQQYEYKQRYAKAKALFDERCKTAGEKIYRTVEGVEGIFLKNPRARRTVSDKSSMNWIGAGFPGASGGQRYIMEFLYFNHPPKDGHSRSLNWINGGVGGFHYVDVDEEGGRVRYRLEKDEGEAVSGELVNLHGYRLLKPHEGEADFSVEYMNIDDSEGRSNWIAGGRIIVRDNRTKEMLGEFVNYAFDPGLGNRSGERSPWGFAIQCIPHEDGASIQIRSFVEKIIFPKQGG